MFYRSSCCFVSDNGVLIVNALVHTLICVCDQTHIMLSVFILSLIEIFDQNLTTVALYN